MKVAEFFASVSLRPDPKGIREMNRMFRMMRGAAIGLGAFFGGGALARGLIGFNSRMEDAKLQIAGMLALAKKTDLADQVGVANQMYDDLRKKAAELPGETEDYINMLGMLIQPMAQAGASMEQMESLTVNAMIAARGLKEGWQKAGRDISEFINFGKMNQVDTFIRRIIEPLGFVGDAGKKRLKAMTQQQRLELALHAFGQKQIQQLGDAQARTFSGQMDKMRDAVKMFLGRVGLPLFQALTKMLGAANDWLSKNEKAVRSLAESIGGALMTAFSAVGKVIKFFASNSDEARAILKALLTVAGLLIGKMLAGWLMFAAPILLVTARIALLWYLFQKLSTWMQNDFVAAIVTVFAGVLLFRIKAVTTAIWGMVRGLLAARAAAASIPAAQGAGAAINAMGSFALGPGGRPGAQTVVGKGLNRGGGGGGGGGGAGALGGGLMALGPIGAALGAAVLIDSLIPTSIPWAAFGRYRRLGEGSGTTGSISQTVHAPINVTIHGVQNAEEITPAMQAALEKELRHLQVATSGGKR